MSSFVRQNEKLFLLFGVFVVSFGVFFVLQNNAIFADPDSFYHARLGVLTSQQGAVREFPWLPFTTLGQHYIDQHWLYHVALIPFVRLLDPLAGIKLATVFFAALLITVAAWFLIKQGLRHVLVWALVLLAATPFTFRISLAKAPSLSLATLLIGIWLMFAKKKLATFLIAWFFVLLYGGFLVLIAAAGIFLLVNLAYDFFQRQNQPGILKPLLPRPWWNWPGLKKYQPLQVFLCVLSGAAVGLLLNPFFPNTFNFIWEQAVQIGLVNYRKIIGVGGEWYPYGFTDFIGNNIVVVAPFVLAVIFYLNNLRRSTVRGWTMFWLAVFFSVFTLKSRRYVEYAVPFLALSAATMLHEAVSSEAWQKLKVFLKTQAKTHKIISAALIAYFLISLPLVIWRDQKANYDNLNSGINATHYQASATWLAEHSQPGEVVFHSDWDDFPVLFYYNTVNAYIAGLDPTFLYRQDQARYWAWAKTTLGERRENLGEVFEMFNTRWILIEKDHTEMHENVKNTPGVNLAYEDKEVWIYEWQGE
ncbi:hypothetical protein C4546_01820 [Candidatus Parcubacteria bacterium]|jgi:hypothetical protein|nr:MAG: hypothetical protein C4546_01820 [Candidatus Parcubacteria bacterium]